MTLAFSDGKEIVRSFWVFEGKKCKEGGILGVRLNLRLGRLLRRRKTVGCEVYLSKDSGEEEILENDKGLEANQLIKS